MKQKLFKRVTSLLLSAAVAVGSSSMIPAFAAANAPKPYVVIPKSGYFQSIKDIYRDKILENLNLSEHIWNGRTLLMNLSALDALKLKLLNKIAAVSEDIDVKACTDGEPTSGSSSEWNMKMIHSDTAPEAPSGEKVKVAIIDSGVDDTPNITVTERQNFVPREDDVFPCFDDPTGHGTSIAGIIAANGEENGYIGINPNVDLYSAKVFDFTMTAPVSRIIEAIYWAIEEDADIINLSFGTPQDNEALHTAVTDAYRAGILIVAAAGNNGTVEYPAAYPEVMAVGSVDSQGNSAQATAEGEELELTAPGERVASTSHFGGVGVASGTSLAAPHVVGAASVLWQKDKSKDSEFIRSVLNASANRADETEYGSGVVDLAYAQKVYDQVNGQPMLLDAEGGVEANTSELNTSENDYVEGSWGKDDHEALVSNSSLTVMKKGTRANDNLIYGMENHPLLHGYAKDLSVSYVAAYMIMIDIARYMYANYGKSTPNMSNTYNYPIIIFETLTNTITREGIYGIVGKDDPSSKTYSWEYALNFNETTPNAYTVNIKPSNENICAFLYGMAAHIAADIFAHSAFVMRDAHGNKIDKYQHIMHSKTNPEINFADDVTYFPNRFICARELVGKVVDHYCLNSRGTLNDFVLSGYYANTEISFKLRYMSDYVKQLGGTTLYNQNKGYFDAITTDLPIK